MMKRKKKYDMKQDYFTFNIYRSETPKFISDIAILKCYGRGFSPG